MKAQIVLSLNRLEMRQLVEPTFFLLHQMVANMVNAMHYSVFKQIVQVDFGFGVTDNETELKTLFNNELVDHGDKNIAKFCEDNNLYISLSFDDSDDTVVAISAPDFCRDALQLSYKLIQTLGYRFQAQSSDDESKFYAGRLVKYQTFQHTVKLPTLITRQNELDSIQKIFSQLSYGIVCFSSIGTIQTISPSILTLLNLEENDSSLEVFARSISIHFYNDVIWGMVLETPNGKFENYRVRISTNKGSEESVLFNVSGYRDDNSSIHTLWQQISLEGGNTTNLSEGDILNEARVHNITRNYVPQLVEKKAREVVRLGGNLLNNEECYIAVLFCDIVGFTTFVEQNEEEESIIHVLNSVLRRISLSVKKYGGFIDKFMGDCIMVLFRSPHDAVVAALEMQKHSSDINQLRNRAELDKLQLRIGIHWGKVIIGNVGTPERLDWTTIGDVVNTASRIEKSCQPEGVLISEKMREAIALTEEMKFKCSDTFYISVKGKREKLAVCYAYSVD
ncbi:MAG: adenylate/guanylate cyclase domain-containing protein [Burkholderiales bacterium]|nr:adenylate/guanylate cyclase domain-containing protein [Nitrosomonas sp.]MCP5274197.1 adenylate/guanylate cyclase domain-containing protein [Burkholderiales bacterium]